jgi:hypothetical protein
MIIRPGCPVPYHFREILRILPKSKQTFSPYFHALVLQFLCGIRILWVGL